MPIVNPFTPAVACKVSRYYKFQSKIYDATRWSFLFGFKVAMSTVNPKQKAIETILEVGCGTGKNLVHLVKKYPGASITGIDLSEDMLKIARRKTTELSDRLTLIHGTFGEISLPEKFDLVVFSYCLTMVNPGWENLIERAKQQLKPGGKILVVDFHDAGSAFQRHMAGHHVRMDGHLLPALRKAFKTEEEVVRRAYGGVWRWFYFVGGVESH